jgi:hypothetical protein
MNSQKYNAQALAISMVVLVVCSIVGISIYSRVTKDKTLTIDEQASSEALEISDLIIDYMIQAPIEDVLSQYESMTPQNGEMLTSGEISTYLNDLGIQLSDLEPLSSGICQPGQGGNEHYLKVEEADENTFFEIRPGQVKSFVVKNLVLGEDCDATITLTVRGEEKTGFSISKIYASETGDIKEYEETDIEHYCFSSGAVCNNENFTGDGWTEFTVDNSLGINLVEEVDYEGTTYTLEEVRVKAIAGTVAVSQDLDETCASVEGLRMIHIIAGANCNGAYRAKEILIPETKWYSTIFDYVIFNGEGSI